MVGVEGGPRRKGTSTTSDILPNLSVRCFQRGCGSGLLTSVNPHICVVVCVYMYIYIYICCLQEHLLKCPQQQSICYYVLIFLFFFLERLILKQALSVSQWQL